ncbi:MAG: hypothetical protein NC401_18590, partial [Ruminococcus sp.]|nr:hypothetical protein [Ruminococcus sp.]
VSSFYNISVDTAAMKLQSAMSGQVMPMRELGFAIEETTLKQVALNHGITQSVETMTQAQKAQLRYVAMMEQAGSIGVLGDMARTIDTASNGMRVLEARIQQFSRAIGNMLMPWLSAVLPYLTAFVQVLTEGAQRIAEFFGFELPKIDFSGASVSAGYDDITESIDGATEASEKFKGSLANIDQLNIIGSDDDGKAAGTGSQYDLGIILPEYDFLQGVESKTKQIADNITDWFKNALPWIEAVGAGIAAAFVTVKVKDFLGFLGQVKDVFGVLGNMAGGKFGAAVKTFTGIAGGLAAGATSGVLFYNSVKNLITGTGKLENNIAMLGGGIAVVGGAIAAFIALGNPVGAVITGIVAGIGAIAGVVKGLDEKTKALNDEMAASILYDNGGTKISEIADAFNDWADAAASVNRETIDKYGQLDEYGTKIDGVLATMQEIAGVDINPAALTPEEAENLREPFSDLCTYLETDFEKRTQTVADDLKNIFTDLGLGAIVSSEIGQAYTEMQELFSRNLTESQTLVDGYLKQIADGGTLTEAQQLEFAREYSYVTGRQKLDDENFTNINKALNAFSELDLSKIDLESDVAAQSALQSIRDSADAYVNSAMERYKAETDNLDKLREYADYDYAKGKLTQEEYRQQLDLLDFSEAVFAENLNKELSDMESNINSVLSPLDSQLYDVSSRVTPTFTQALMSAEYAKGEGKFFDSDYTSQIAREFAQGEWLENNPIYQMTRELESFVGETHRLTVETELPIDNKYSETFAMIKKAMDGERFDLNLVPQIVEPADNDKIYEEATKTFKSETSIDWSRYNPPYANNSANVGVAREAYEQAAQQSSTTNSGEMEAFITIQNYLDVDGDILAEKVETRQATMRRRMNGR